MKSKEGLANENKQRERNANVFDDDLMAEVELLYKQDKLLFIRSFNRPRYDMKKHRMIKQV